MEKDFCYFSNRVDDERIVSSYKQFANVLPIYRLEFVSLPLIHSPCGDIFVRDGIGRPVETERDVTVSERREPRAVGDMETMGADSEIVEQGVLVIGRLAPDHGSS